jgi:hypothetical protein
MTLSALKLVVMVRVSESPREGHCRNLRWNGEPRPVEKP